MSSIYNSVYGKTVNMGVGCSRWRRWWPSGGAGKQAKEVTLRVTEAICDEFDGECDILCDGECNVLCDDVRHMLCDDECHILRDDECI
jgi:hypothetical protein